MNDEVNEKLKKIKQSFRLMMNGEASHSMRDKGVGYKINWGVSLPQLSDMASEYGKDYDLAIALWKEDIRECKILATLIMPAEKMSMDLAELWMEQIHSQEESEICAFNLFQHLDFSPVLAYKWMASDKELYQICAYNILSRLFSQGKEPNDRGINEFLDQVSVALQCDNAGVKHSALNCVVKFASLNDNYAIIAKTALKTLNLDIF